MSTRSTIRHGQDWHLYEDLYDDAVEGELPVHIEFEYPLEVEILSGRKGSWVRIKITRALARELGLIAKEKE